LAAAPLVDDAFSDGKLSFAQVKVVAGAGAVDPSCQEQLIDAAQHESFKELRDRAERVKRAALGEAREAAKEARACRKRYLRAWAPDEGGLRFEAWVPKVDGARVLSVIEREADAVFREVHGRREPRLAYLADAFVRVVCGDGTAKPKADVHLRVDLAALRRGAVEGDERCEIDGVRDGTDVKTVTSRKRTVPTPLRTALIERDRTCAVPGCPNTRYLEIDHDWEFAKGGPTSLENLQLLCAPHHRMKTTLGFRLVRGPDGTRQWVTPPGRGAVSPTTAPDGRRSAGAGRRAPSRAAADRRR
jgi:5-methylcytosine-specific restriction endonuclease McrA